MQCKHIPTTDNGLFIQKPYPSLSICRWLTQTSQDKIAFMPVLSRVWVTFSMCCHGAVSRNWIAEDCTSHKNDISRLICRSASIACRRYYNSKCVCISSNAKNHWRHTDKYRTASISSHSIVWGQIFVRRFDNFANQTANGRPLRIPNQRCPEARGSSRLYGTAIRRRC